MSDSQIFLAYGDENKEEAEALRNNLIASGFNVWWDQNLLPGQDWRYEIRKAMKNSRVVLLCLLPDPTENDRVISGK